MVCPSCNHKWNLDKKTLMDVDMLVNNFALSNGGNVVNSLHITGECPRCKGKSHKEMNLKDILIKAYGL